jgi:2'-5' RNA ligase
MMSPGYFLIHPRKDSIWAQRFRQRLLEFQITEVNLESADVIFSFLSPEAFSETWLDMHRALTRHDLEYAHTIPIILRPSLWKAATVGRLEALPKDEVPVSDHPNGQRVLDEIAEQFKRGLPNIRTRIFYKRLGAKGLSGLHTGDIEQVKHFDNPAADSRLGITLKVPISQEVSAEFTRVVRRMKRFAPENLYYEAPQFHFTILSLITAHEAFDLSKVPVEKARRAIEEVVGRSPPLEVNFRGICATPNSIIARGFPDADSLEQIRDALRQNLSAEFQPDDRYRIQAAHVTLGRLRQGVNQDALMAQIGKLRNEPLGKMQVKTAELVVNDFFMLPEKVQLLANFRMGDLEGGSQIVPPGQPDSQISGTARLPDRVVGRDKERDQIVGILLQQKQPIIVTSGFGGIGKSTLAAYVVNSCVAEFHLIAWLDARQYVDSQRLSLDAMLLQIAKAAGIAPEVSSLPSLEERSQRIVQELCRCRALLVFDNYESLLSVPGIEQEVSDFIRRLPLGPQPGEAGNRIGVIVTTRKVTNQLKELNPWHVTPAALCADDSIDMMKAVSQRKPRQRPLPSLTDSEYTRVHDLMHGLPKYMEVAIDQLTHFHFSDWEQQVKVIPVPLDESDRFFGNLFALSWKNPKILAGDVQRVLLAMTHFVGNASFEALRCVSGLDDAAFGRAVDEAYPHLVPSKQRQYTVHPLTHVFCKSQISSPEFSSFRQQSAERFIEFFRGLAKSASDLQKHSAVEKDLSNLVAAAQFAFVLQSWHYVLELQENLSGFLRESGHWQELIDLLEIAERVCERTHNSKLLCTHLVHHHAWVLLRREELHQADQVINEGMQLAIELKDHDCHAQANRHAGKSALLKADYELFELYQPGETWHDYFRQSERHYQESLEIREGSHGRQKNLSAIADMKMDFGRLYWLHGRKLEREGRKQRDRELLQQAFAKYEQALRVSLEGKELSMSIPLARGISKACGNCGNAAKEMARYFFREQQLPSALKGMEDAESYYLDNLRIGEQIGKRDEVSHALWGLAEVYEFVADHDPKQSNPWVREELLWKALHHAQDSHRFYRSFGGGRDIGVTESLVNRIQCKISSEYTVDYFNGLAAGLKTESLEPPSGASFTDLKPFQQILAMKGKAIPHLLETLKWETGPWLHYALEILTGASPIDVESNGDQKLHEQCSMPEKVENWLTWGREQGLTA